MEINKVGIDRALDKNVQKADTTSQSRQSDQAEKTKDVQQNVSAKVKWSDEASLLAEGVKAVKEAPEVRSEKVNALKAAIAEGSYKIDADSIADRMIGDALANDLLTRKG